MLFRLRFLWKSGLVLWGERLLPLSIIQYDEKNVLLPSVRYEANISVLKLRKARRASSLPRFFERGIFSSPEFFNRKGLKNTFGNYTKMQLLLHESVWHIVSLHGTSYNKTWGRREGGGEVENYTHHKVSSLSGLASPSNCTFSYQRGDHHGYRGCNGIHASASAPRGTCRPNGSRPRYMIYPLCLWSVWTWRRPQSI